MIENLITVVGGAIIFVIGRKSKKLDQVDQLSRAYNKFILDAILPLEKLTARVNELEVEFAKEKKKNQKLEEDFLDLQIQNAKLQEVADHWKSKFEGLQKLYNDLKKEFETYKKSNK